MDKTIYNKNQITAFVLMVFIGLIFVTQAYAFLPASKQSMSVTNKQHQEIVVLVHGLMRTSWSMVPLKFYLEKQGYKVYYYSYPSPKYTIQQHGMYLNQYIRELLVKNPGTKVDFITHSLGGIIAREALSKLKADQLKNIGCLIMLAPPNQGSQLAKLSINMLPIIKSAIKPLAELSSDDAAYVHHVPVPKVKIGIIAGRYDAKVPPEYARLPGQAEPVIVNSNHTFILTSAKTKELVKHFLEKGTFK